MPNLNIRDGHRLRLHTSLVVQDPSLLPLESVWAMSQSATPPNENCLENENFPGIQTRTPGAGVVVEGAEQADDAAGDRVAAVPVQGHVRDGPPVR